MSTITEVKWHSGQTRFTFAADGSVRFRVRPEDDPSEMSDFVEALDKILEGRTNSLRGKVWIDDKGRPRIKLFRGTKPKLKAYSSHVFFPDTKGVQSTFHEVTA